MKNMRFSFSRGLALFLCIVLFAALLPTAALAGDYTDIIVTYNRQGVRADVGETLTLKAKTDLPAALLSGTPSYQWYKASGNIYGTGTAIPGAIGASYTVPTNTTGMSYYYCVVTAKLKDGSTINSVNSDSPIIWVNVQNIGDGFDAYHDGELDTYISYWSGEEFTFSPGQMNDESKTVTYQWYECDAEGFPVRETLNDGRAFLIYGIPDEMMMKPIYYKCVATAFSDKTGIEKDEVLFSAVLYPMGVEGEPPVITSQPKDVDAVVGDTVTFSVVAEGENLHYEWWYVDAGAPFSFDTDSPTLSLKTHMGWGGMNFWCIVTNEAGTATSEKAHLTVSEKPYVFPFNDVPTGAWYYESVQEANKMGLINGKTTETYCPNDNITKAEVVKLAVCLNILYNGGDPATDIANGTPWYKTYMDYAVEHNIIMYEMSAVANETSSRDLFVYILSHALPAEAFTPINTIPNGSIPDVAAPGDELDSFEKSIYMFYRAGILNGADSKGTFNPHSPIKRSEVATILVRMMDPDLRVGAPSELGK